MVAFKAGVWTEGWLVCTGLTIVDCSVSLVCRTVTANNAVMKLRMFIQQMELFLQPLWVSIIGVLAFSWASKAATRWSRGKIPGCQAFYNGTSVSQMIWVPWCCNPCVDYKAVDYCRLK